MPETRVTGSRLVRTTALPQATSGLDRHALQILTQPEEGEILLLRLQHAVELAIGCLFEECEEVIGVDPVRVTARSAPFGLAAEMDLGRPVLGAPGVEARRDQPR